MRSATQNNVFDRLSVSGRPSTTNLDPAAADKSSAKRRDAGSADALKPTSKYSPTTRLQSSSEPRPPMVTTTKNLISASTATSTTTPRTAAKPALPKHARPPSITPAANPPPSPTNGAGSGTGTGTGTGPASGTAKPPLTPRDQNALLVTRQPAATKPATMPTYERPTNTTARPPAPPLSAGAQRAARTPLTPKIAAKAPSTSTLGVARAQTPSTVPAQRPKPASTKRNSHEEETPSHISSNVTPRSATRRDRVESAQSTPNGTPNPDRFDGWDRLSKSPGLSGDAPRRPAVTFSSELNLGTRPEPQHNPDSKFFYASDAKGANPKPPPKPPQPNPVPAKGPTFFHASGHAVDKRSSGEHKLPPGPHLLHHPNDSKFFHANGSTPELRPHPPTATSRPTSIISTASKTPSKTPSRAASAAPASGHHAVPRPNSPGKLAQAPTLAPMKKSGHLPPPPVSKRSSLTSPLQLAPTPPLRRTSTGTSSHSGSHSRSGSLQTEQGLRSPQVERGLRSPQLEHGLRSPQLPHIASGPSSPRLASNGPPAPLTLASIIQAAEELSGDEQNSSGEGDEGDDDDDEDEARSELQSPTKSSHSGEAVSDLVAKARQERKVQDLQIRNGSLEAINRTLERQLRKQTAELRRFRRLSRSGRLSMAASTMANRADDDSRPPDAKETLSDLSEEISEADDDLGEDSLSDSETESLSPSAMEERDAKHREKDEERLKIDLTKHQELLSDSHKLNSSIKRCLDWTGELIKDGKKALEHRVQVGDVALGGRVLREDEIVNIPDIPDDTMSMDERFEELNKELDQLERPPPRLAGWKPEAQDRDSGVDFPVGG